MIHIEISVGNRVNKKITGKFNGLFEIRFIDGSFLWI